MFEDIKKQDQEMMRGNARQLEDMFDAVDPAPAPTSALKEGKLTPAAGHIPPPPAPVGPRDPLTHLSQVDAWTTKRPRRGFKIGLFVVAFLVAAGAVVYFLFLRTAGTPATPPANFSSPETNEAPANPPLNEAPATNAVPSNALIDADNDGLTDAEEKVLGTDPTSVDSDSDGLSDRDETRVYKTNPLNPDSDNDGLGDRDEIFVWITDPLNVDTDGDTYKDGEEVANGYSPTGPGKLTPEQIPQ